MEVTNAVDAVALLLASGGTAENVSQLLDRLGVDVGRDEVVEDARRKLHVAANYDRDHELGVAKTRLEDLYSRCMKSGDLKTAGTTQKEINKLLGLYQPADKGARVAAIAGAVASKSEDPELKAIRDHVLPLKLAPESYPLREHVRIMAELVREARAKK